MPKKNHNGLCPSCKVQQNESDFYRDRRSGNIAGRCKSCLRKYNNNRQKEWRKNNPEKAKAADARQREKNREKVRKAHRKYVKNSPEKYMASRYRSRERLRLRILKHYGEGKLECLYCGEKDADVLVIDHINDDGAEHRRKMGISGRGTGGTVNTFDALRRDGLPEGLQTLCANCNMKKEQERRRANRVKNPYYSPDHIESYT